MLQTRHIARGLAATMLAGTWSQRSLESRSSEYLGRSTSRWQRRLVAEVLAQWRATYPPPPDVLSRMLVESRCFERAAAVVLRSETPPALALDPPAFAPARAFAAVGAPRIETVGDLARWLGLSVDRLEWLADTRRQHGRSAIPVLQHYSYRFVAKRSGGPPRLIEAPKSALKQVQRRILSEILTRAPVHPHAHGFVRGRSCLSGARIHAGEAVVICLDLKDFFASIRAARIVGLFRCIGYPSGVARALAGLCTTATPLSVFDRLPEPTKPSWRARKVFGAPHLAQGAPTSPALANLCAWRLDRRCAGLAAALGGQYTRYADDLTFSGDARFAQKAPSLIKAVSKIAEDEGFVVNSAKTRVMVRARQQRVTGVVVNAWLNVSRTSFDTLKAVLHNCQRRGPAAENRHGNPDFRAELDGRVGWVEQVNPARGAKLRLIFDSVAWEQ